ncbi:hypothetical protein PHYPSEUDO_013689 [Phytophthora pseudosyringae]|uniref:Uncharacterized protein n=1 Tax=Phytophthora pseudosyringae TaxID=221518 RepID=A0A8T1W6H5_9STRA|nr:hypothetical protein PHYPSEUDO_013689 [Phytophthora pseudosyringae]
MTREALELLVLVNKVDKLAWKTLLLEKCGLGFSYEEAFTDANNDVDVPGTLPATGRYQFQFEKDREVPMTAKFLFDISRGRDNRANVNGTSSLVGPVISGTSTNFPRSVEIPVSLCVGTGERFARGKNDTFPDYMKELRGMLNSVKSRSQQLSAASVEMISDCASVFTFTYCLVELSLIVGEVVGVNADLGPPFSELILDSVASIGSEHSKLFTRELADPTSHLGKNLELFAISTCEESRAVDRKFLKRLRIALKKTISSELKPISLATSQRNS